MFEKDSVALVTGAAAGIGLETATAFARVGCRTVLADRDETRGRQAADGLNAMGFDSAFIKADMANADDIIALHRQIANTYGRLDAACNNAGIEGDMAPTAESSVENFDRVIGINLRGVFICMREQINLMRQRKQGAIVNIASVAGLVGFAGLPAYCASKGGVVQLTRTAAIEYAVEGLRVNAVCPGAIQTEMIDRITHHDPAAEKQFAAIHPMNRMGTAREIADTVVWLCSSQASFITGQALAVDGGLVAR
jgi:NAD(P)-dependent dehydrogenase (short-subunit alcohol dehydrogenase family)